MNIVLLFIIHIQYFLINKFVMHSLNCSKCLMDV